MSTFITDVSAASVVGASGPESYIKQALSDIALGTAPAMSMAGVEAAKRHFGSGKDRTI